MKSLPEHEAPRSGDRCIFSPLLRREQNPSEAEISSHLPASLRSRFSVKGDKFSSLAFLFIFSVVIRFYKLGVIPRGLSLNEVYLGLYLSSLLGKWVLEPFFVRLPFAILGVVSILLFYFLLQKLTGNSKLSLLTTFFLSISPWHIMESRIVSLGIVLTFFLLTFSLIISNKLQHHIKLLTNFFFTFGLFFFVISWVSFFPKVSKTVDMERRLASNRLALTSTKLFSNKVVNSFSEKTKFSYEQMDPGVYFFTGHPRQRGGVEETPKLFLSFIPLIVLGFLKAGNRIKVSFITLFFFLVAVLSLFEYRSASLTLPILFILICMAGFGFYYLSKKKKMYVFLVPLTLLLSYELLIFTKLYFSGFSESMFSPRRNSFQPLITAIQKVRGPDERVVVNERLGDPKLFFKFYLKDLNLAGYEFREYNIWSEKDRNFLFVDVLPFEPSPAEPLWHEGAAFPKDLTLLFELNDTNLNQEVFIYRYE